MALGSALRADAPAPPPVEDGYRNVAIKHGDKTTYIQVKDAREPFTNVKDSGGGSPDHFSFSRTSPMANQKYDLGDTASSHDTDSYQKGIEHTFITKSYFDGADSADKSTPGLHDSVPVNAAEGYSIRAAGYDKSFLAANTDVGQNKVAEEADSTSSYQGQTAVLGGHDIKTFSNPMGSKTYQGPEAEAVKSDLDKMNLGLLGLKDLPDRALINHGVKPDTDKAPPAPSKALNDPDYMPDAAPAPLRTGPGENHHLLDQNDNQPDNDIIPSPGMMAHPQPAPAPENSEPLPQ